VYTTKSLIENFTPSSSILDCTSNSTQGENLHLRICTAPPTVQNDLFTFFFGFCFLVWFVAISFPASPVHYRKCHLLHSMSELKNGDEATAATKNGDEEIHHDAQQAPRRPRVKTLSDVSNMVIENHIPQEDKPKRRKQLSSDIVHDKFFTPGMGNEDLNLAEAVAVQGTVTARKDQGINEADITEQIEHRAEGTPDDFVFNEIGLSTEEAEKLLAIHGKNELPEKNDPKWLIFLRLFWAPMPIMIWLAIIIEAGIENFVDMGILLFIQFANASISFYETNKAGNAIAALKSSLKPQATVKRDGKWQVINATLLVPSDLVLLGSGSAIPADCRVNHSEIDVDQAALTGESLPVTFYKGDSCKMGSTVVRGEVEVRFHYICCGIV
jgi:magnesium-transporting ATPase (P-type)